MGENGEQGGERKNLILDPPAPERVYNAPQNEKSNVPYMLNVDLLAKSNKFTAFSAKFLNVLARFFVLSIVSLFQH